MPVYLEFYFWLFLISLGCFLLERLCPWRPQQEILRKGFVQDLFWLVFNKQYVGWVLAVGTVALLSFLDREFTRWGFPVLEDFKLLSAYPFWAQFLLAFVVKDFIEWNIHRLFHRIPFLWEFHKLHHSIEELDWLGAFRFHWMELIVYRMFSYLPLVLLGVSEYVVLAIAIVGTLFQELSHANLKFDWGVFRYVFNSPRFHSWHHDVKMYGKGGQNFAVSLSIWDWLFRTAYWPVSRDQPKKIGFHGMKNYPKSVLGRLIHPFVKPKK